MILEKVEFEYQLSSDLNRLDLVNFVQNLSENGEVIFFGGYVRDLLVNYNENNRDIDIVFSSKSSCKMLDFIIYDYFDEVERNLFGGYKIRLSDVTIDIWNLEDTWAFKENKLRPSVNNLEHSTFLKMDSITYNFNHKIINSKYFHETITKKRLDVQLEENPDLELNLIKNLVQKKKYEKIFNITFEFSDQLKKMYIDFNTEDSVERIYNRQLSRYKEEIYTIKELEQFFYKLKHSDQ